MDSWCSEIPSIEICRSTAAAVVKSWRLLTKGVRDVLSPWIFEKLMTTESSSDWDGNVDPIHRYKVGSSVDGVGV